MFMLGLNESDMINMLSGNGGCQVDLVFYVFTQSKFSLNQIPPVLTAR